MFNRIDRPIETTIIEPAAANRVHDPDPSVRAWLGSFRRLGVVAGSVFVAGTY